MTNSKTRDVLSHFSNNEFFENNSYLLSNVDYITKSNEKELVNKIKYYLIGLYLNYKISYKKRFSWIVLRSHFIITIGFFFINIILR